MVHEHASSVLHRKFLVANLYHVQGPCQCGAIDSHGQKQMICNPLRKEWPYASCLEVLKVAYGWPFCTMLNNEIAVLTMAVTWTVYRDRRRLILGKSCNRASLGRSCVFELRFFLILSQITKASDLLSFPIIQPGALFDCHNASENLEIPPNHLTWKLISDHASELSWHCRYIYAKSLHGVFGATITSRFSINLSRDRYTGRMLTMHRRRIGTEFGIVFHVE